jgi:hypothetical protein
MSEIEAEVLAKYSSDRLRKGELDRSAKKDHLNSQGMSRLPKERDKILDQMYGPERE